MEKDKKKPTLHQEIEGLLKEKEFVLHCISITSSTGYFNQLNEELLKHFIQHSKDVGTEQERENFIATLRHHFNEIKQLRMLYDNLKKAE